MSIASEITRIQTAKENIKTSIINKGGTLASDALLSDYAAAIDNISTGIEPSGILDITDNGDYNVLDKASVHVNLPVGEWGQGTVIYEGDFEQVTSIFSITSLQDGTPFEFDKIVVELSNVNQGQNVQKRTYWRSDQSMSGYNEPLIIDGGSQYRQGITYNATTIITIEDNTYIGLRAINYDTANLTSTVSYYQRKEHNGLDKITAYGWWSWNCPADAHIKITGYNRMANTLIDWDEILYPTTDQTDAFYNDKVFNCKYISQLNVGDTVIIEAFGHGKICAFRGSQPTSGYPQEFKIGEQTSSDILVKLTLNITETTSNFILAGYQWSDNNSHSGYNYNCFFGEYLKYKIIRAESAQE